ncbi:MAG TPA: Gfo/Idh/MocA family oxidoreductase [Vicinamibacterales bacterium]|nr:Gfo/Idh/MocA family oxidoreductase [Vicinamibacterales bacterium]
MSKQGASTALIVGCGRIAGGYNAGDERLPLTHVVAYRRAAIEVRACCDRDAAVAAAFAQRWSIPLFGTDPEALLAEVAPDAVSICTPAEGRLPLVHAVVRSSARAVLLEKPLADTAAGARAVRDAVRTWGGAALVNYTRAFDPFYIELNGEMQAGVLGPVREVVARYYGSARTNASHLLERVLAALGSPTAVRRLSGDDQAPLFEVSFGAVRATFLPTIGCAWSPMELDFLCERGRVRVIDGEQRVERFEAGPDPRFPGYDMLVPVESSGSRPATGDLTFVFDALVRALAGETADAALLERAAAVNEILERVET